MSEQSRTIKAIIGLGNPGNQYYYTRHSIGFRIVDALAQIHHLAWHAQENFDVAELETEGVTSTARTIYFLKPRTFMNSSGLVVPWLKKKGIKPSEIVVVHDELEKSFGTMSLKIGGSPRGHNGLRSLIKEMGEEFWRLRFGVGRPPPNADVAQYVLSNFSKQEEEQLMMLLIEAAEQLETVCRE